MGAWQALRHRRLLSGVGSTLNKVLRVAGDPVLSPSIWGLSDSKKVDVHKQGCKAHKVEVRQRFVGCGTPSFDAQVPSQLASTPPPVGMLGR